MSPKFVSSFDESDEVIELELMRSELVYLEGLSVARTVHQRSSPPTDSSLTTIHRIEYHGVEGGSMMISANIPSWAWVRPVSGSTTKQTMV